MTPFLPFSILYRDISTIERDKPIYTMEFSIARYFYTAEHFSLIVINKLIINTTEIVTNIIDPAWVKGNVTQNLVKKLKKSEI